MGDLQGFLPSSYSRSCLKNPQHVHSSPGRWHLRPKQARKIARAIKTISTPAIAGSIPKGGIPNWGLQENLPVPSAPAMLSSESSGKFSFQVLADAKMLQFLGFRHHLSRPGLASKNYAATGSFSAALYWELLLKFEAKDPDTLELLAYIAERDCLIGAPCRHLINLLPREGGEQTCYCLISLVQAPY